MIVTLGCAGVGFALLGIQYFTPISGEIAAVLDCAVPGLLAIAFLWMIYRAFFATPNCPSCAGRKVVKMGIYVENEPGHHTPSRWRRYRCTKCCIEFLIPGVSVEG
jgi:protein-S-isoprenylcysteine O-methyltransferase Ste14